MSQPENRDGIRTGSGGGTPPFEYPHGIFIHHPEATIAQTEAWVGHVRQAWSYFGSWLQGRPDQGSKYKLLNWLTNLEQTQSRLVGEFFDRNQRPVTPLQPGSWLGQRNVYGIQTCQVVSAINALRFLGLYDPNRHTEEDFVAALGPPQSGQYETRDIARVLPTLAPEVRFRRSNSVAEMVEAAANGAAAMFPYSNDHEALIPPGFQLRRSAGGNIEVQVANSLSNYAEFLPIERLIRSEIIMSQDPNSIENSVLIIEGPQPSGIRTVPTQRRPITIVPGIRTVESKPPRIVTVN